MEISYKNRQYINFLEKCYHNPVVLLEISSICNFKCEYCLSRLKLREKRFMPEDLFKHIAQQVPTITDLPLRLHIDGEPTLHPKFIQYANFLNKMEIPFGLATNGSLLSTEHAQIQMGIVLSISSNEIEFKKRIKNLNYDKYINNILSYLKEWLLSDSEQNIYIQIPMDLNEKNEKYVQEKHQFVTTVLSRLSIAGSSDRYELFETDDTVYIVKKNGYSLRFYFWDISSSANYSPPTQQDPKIKHGFCSMPWQEMAILSDGRVSFCCSDLSGGTAYTREKDIWERSLLDIWQDKKIVKIRRNFLKNNPTLDICKRCLASVPDHQFYSFDHPFDMELRQKSPGILPLDSLGKKRKEKIVDKVGFVKKHFSLSTEVPIYNGWWYNPSESGTSLSLEVQEDKLMSAVYTYDIQSGEPIWYYSSGRLDDSTHYSGNLLMWKGWPLGNAYQPPHSSTIGTVEIKFPDRAEATLDWSIGTSHGTKHLTRFLDKIAPGERDQRDIHGWWYDPDYNGMGFFY